MTARTVALLCLFAFGAWVKPALAAKSFDQCQYYVDTVPTVITTPGMWCLRKDLKVTSYANSAINIQASNTTLDCKDFAIDGTAISPDQAQWAIVSDQRHDVTVRNCNIRGFLYGISFHNTTSKGNSVINNRISKSYGGGIWVVGDGSVVRGNAILDSGNGGDGNPACGISVWGPVDVIDNLVHGVNATNASVCGISANEFNGHIIGNRVRGLSAGIVSHPSVAIAIISASNAVVRDNDISGDALPLTAGLWCRFATGRVEGNIIKGMETPLMECNLGQGNDISY
jgi:hypothetical protein